MLSHALVSRASAYQDKTPATQALVLSQMLHAARMLRVVDMLASPTLPSIPLLHRLAAENAKSASSVVATALSNPRLGSATAVVEQLSALSQRSEKLSALQRWVEQVVDDNYLGRLTTTMLAGQRPILGGSGRRGYR